MKYKLLGKEEMNHTCEFCNKTSISVCYVVETDCGEIQRFGSTCIKKALKITASELKNKMWKDMYAMKQKILCAFSECDAWKLELQLRKMYGL